VRERGRERERDREGEGGRERAGGKEGYRDWKGLTGRQIHG